jgi:hypothetical protein
MSGMSSRREQLVWLPAVGTVLSILSCYGTLGVVTGLSLMGITLAPNVHVWAAAIVIFALVAVLGLAFGCRRHGSVGALVLGIVGALVVIFAFYGSHAIRPAGIPRIAVEVVGFVILIVAAIWDWQLREA